MTSINTMSPGVRGVAALGIRIAGRMADAVNHGGHGWHGRRDDGGIDERRLDDGEMREGRPSRHGGRVRIRFFRASSYLLALELRALYSPYLQVPRTMRVDQSRRHRAKALGPCRALQGLARPVVAAPAWTDRCATAGAKIAPPGGSGAHDQRWTARQRLNTRAAQVPPPYPVAPAPKPPWCPRPAQAQARRRMRQVSRHQMQRRGRGRGRGRMREQRPFRCGRDSACFA